MAATQTSPFRIVHAVCSHDCPDSCGVLVTVDNTGKAVKVQGDPKHPVTQGFLCGKVAKYLERVYSPNRLLYPLKRKPGVPKGQLKRGEEHAAFERVTWDEALDGIAARLKEVAERYGSESILPYSYAGTIGQLGFGSMDRRLFHRMGASQLDRTICSEAGGVAWNLVYGQKIGTPPEDFKLAKLIVAWGANIHGNNVHLWPMVEQARRDGARLIVIDPYKTRTAALADWHIAIRPGTDAALALGMMHVIFREGLEDRAFIEDRTHGFTQLAERVREYTPERVATWTGMTPGEVEQLAREYATTKPAVLRVNYGIQRAEYGGAAIRAVAMLPAVTGAWKYRGGGGWLSTSGAYAWDKDALQMPELAKSSPIGRLARVVNMSTLGQALTELGQTPESAAKDGPPVHALFVYNSNPGAIAPNQNAVKRGLMREDLFTAVHEQFFTDTTDYADYVLPATTFLEHTDVQGAYGHYFVQWSQQAIEPLGEARSNVWLFAELAKRMGYTEECFNDTAEEMIAQALQVGVDGHSANVGMEHITLENLKREGHIPVALHRDPEGAPLLAFTSGQLATPSGKIEFYSETLAAQGLDPLPGFVPPVESRWGEAAKLYPLEFLPRKADNYMNSTFANLDGHRKMQAKTMHVLEMHRVDAEARGISNGDTVRVWNDRGEVKLCAHVDGSVPVGVVAAQLDWAKLSPGGENVNALTSERLTDLGAAATFYSTLVEVRRANR
ncbi:MAG: molybdopterin-dependent oxidoreductase [Acidobacteriota bacterium]|nr:molybdopterin-dependent oxidoreductase [Acidobacteriota bacterium]